MVYFVLHLDRKSWSPFSELTQITETICGSPMFKSHVCFAQGSSMLEWYLWNQKDHRCLNDICDFTGGSPMFECVFFDFLNSKMVHQCLNDIFEFKEKPTNAGVSFWVQENTNVWVDFFEFFWTTTHLLKFGPVCGALGNQSSAVTKAWPQKKVSGNLEVSEMFEG